MNKINSHILRRYQLEQLQFSVDTHFLPWIASFMLMVCVSAFSILS
ncbi:hypothetical protein X975_10394, partial [Stegodyphus mimosarum]